MNDLVKKLAGMHWNTAHNHLMSMNLPADLRVSLAEQAQKLRDINALHNKRTKLTQYQHDELWYKLIAPLKYDLSNAKVGLKLKPFDSAPERHTAFSEYVTLLEKLLAGLQKLQIDEARKIGDPKESPRTPAEIATERGLPSKGKHWTHWVNDKTKRRIESLFDAIPTQAKRPKPFAYRIPPDMFVRDRQALQRRTLNEIDLVRQEMLLLRSLGEDMTPDQTFRLRELEDELTDMGNAMIYLCYVARNEPLPNTWRGLDKAPRRGKEVGLGATLAHIVADWDNETSKDKYGDYVVWTPEMEQALRLQLGEKSSIPLVKKSNRPKRYKK